MKWLPISTLQGENPVESWQELRGEIEEKNGKKFFAIYFRAFWR
jgi:hypothetical protein